jgi:hypothetical protein
MSNFNQYSDVSNPAVVLYPGDTFTFYANLDELETDTDFSNWHLDLLRDDFTVAVQDIGTLTKDIITGTSYRFYSSFTVPESLTGCYYLVVIDEFYNTVKYISSKLSSTTSEDYTYVVRFRNSKNILNYNYQTLTTYYNRFRVRMNKSQPEQKVTSKGYDLVNGSFNPVRYVKGKTYSVTTLWFDEGDHDAFGSALIHGEFILKELGQYIQYIKDESEYEVDWNDNYPLSEGTIRLQRKNSFSSNKVL